MPKTLTSSNDLGQADVGTKRTIRASHLNDSVEMNAGNEVTLYSRQVPADKLYAHGFGPSDRRAGQTAYAKADLRDDEDNPIEGEVVLAITDSEQRHVVADREYDDLENLREAVEDDRTDRPVQQVFTPAAREDQHIELRIRADSESDGATFDRENSEIKLYFTDIRRSAV